VHPLRRSPSKFAVLALAITLLLVQQGETWHLAWKEHVRCAEHGEWIDVAGPAKAAAASRALHGPLVDAAASSSREHYHCTIVESSRVRATTWDSGLDATPPKPLISPVCAPVPEPVVIGFPRYLLAPKHSPPC
jgi:hypothetical protein